MVVLKIDLYALQASR